MATDPAITPRRKWWDPAVPALAAEEVRAPLDAAPPYGRALRSVIYAVAQHQG